MPLPNKGESKREFISRYMSSSEAQKDVPDKKQRLVVAYSTWSKSKQTKKEITTNKNRTELSCKHIRGLHQVKTTGENLVLGGFIATTHLDDGFELDGVLIRDKIDKPLLDKWATELNEGNPRVNKISVNHDRGDKIVAGVAKRDSAKVIELPDGEYGLYTESIIDSTHPDFTTIENRIDIGTLDSFSIEFEDGSFTDIEPIESEDYVVRHLHDDCTLYGYTLASRPMNEYAVMIKEIMELRKMPEEEKQIKEPIKPIEVKEDPAPAEPAEPKKDDTPVEPAPVEAAATEKEHTLTGTDYAEYQKYKDFQAKESKEKEYTELKESIMTDLKKSLDNVKIQNKVLFNDKQLETKEVLDYKELLADKSKMEADGRVTSKIAVSEQFRRAGKMADMLGLTNGTIKLDSNHAESREFKHFGTNGKFLECKGLGLTTNRNDDTDYLLSAAELHDVFDPVIYTALNQATVTWNLLAKDDYSMKGNNQVQFSVKTAANTTASAYLGNAVTTGAVTRLKVMTKFKKYQVGVEVDGDMIAAARGGPIGDVFSEEVREATIDMLSVINTALFAEAGTETSADIIGFEYLADSAGNATLYNLTRSSTTLSANVFLNPSSAGDTYIDGSSQDITLSNLRAMKRQCLKEGADIGNLVYITDHIQGDKFRGIYDAAQRNVPTSSRWGFEGRPEFDGIPIFEDKDCNTDDWWLIDLETHRVGVWVPPTLEMLGKDADSVKGFIKTYFCTYNRYPRRLVMCYGNATS